METTTTIVAGLPGLPGVTVRALRHYDEIGRPVPAG